MTVFPQNELMARVVKMQNLLAAKEIDLAILNQNTDLFYYTGSVHPLYLLIPVTGTPVMLARKAIGRIQDKVRHLPLEFFTGTKDLVHIMEQYGFNKAKTLGFTCEATTYATVNRMQKLFPGAAIKDLSWDIRALRMVKSSLEIEIQSKAAAIIANLPALVKKHFQPGMTELELSAIIENFFRLNGHGMMVRCRREAAEASIAVCSAGPNSLVGGKFDGICSGIGTGEAFPYGASRTPIAKGLPVLLDYAINLEGYHVDLSRMFCWGNPATQVREAYDAMLNLERTVISMLKPGIPWDEIYDKAVSYAVELGYSAEFMGIGVEKVKFIGHGVGLELDEPPHLAPLFRNSLLEGMVLAVEPKVALPEIGVVGLEDTVVIRAHGAELLTNCSTELLIL